jgi:DNA-directed RNA polymerase subunit E'/Rpb7
MMMSEEVDYIHEDGIGGGRSSPKKQIVNESSSSFNPDNIYVKSTYTEKIAIKPEEQDENIDRILL